MLDPNIGWSAQPASSRNGGRTDTASNPVSVCRPHLTHDVEDVVAKTKGGVPAPNNIETRKIDELGEFVKLDAELFVANPCWQSFFHKVKGQSNFQPQVQHLPH